MADDFLDEEAQIAREQDENELFDSHALRRQLRDLPDLQPVVKVGSTATIRDAIHGMVDSGVGIVLIVEDNKLVGVFSERDVLRKVAGSGLDIDAIEVSELMTANPATLSFDAELVYALNMMEVGGYRHLPLLKNDEPVAVVSMRDILGFIVSLYPDQVLKLADNPDQTISQDREGA